MKIVLHTRGTAKGLSMNHLPSWLPTAFQLIPDPVQAQPEVAPVLSWHLVHMVHQGQVWQINQIVIAHERVIRYSHLQRDDQVTIKHWRSNQGSSSLERSGCSPGTRAPIRDTRSATC